MQKVLLKNIKFKVLAKKHWHFVAFEKLKKLLTLFLRRAFRIYKKFIVLALIDLIGAQKKINKRNPLYKRNRLVNWQYFPT